MPYKIFIVFAFLGCQLSIGQTLPQHYFHLPANSGVNNLFFNQSACEKFQFIYSQSEISTMVSPVSGPVTIDTIWFRFGGGSSNTFTTLSNFQIRMGHTTLTNPGPQFNNNFNVGTAQTVLSSASYTLTPLIGAWNTPNNNWTFIVLQTPFSYNFTNNLCIELSFSSSSAAIAGNYADNGGVPISQYAGNSTATSASATSSRPMFGISSGQACPNVTATSSQINVTCSGGSYGSATVVPSGGTSFTYSWSPSGGSNATALGLSAGNYTCTITNNCGNSTTQAFTLTETNAYQLNATVTQPTCGNNNGCISFAPTPGGTYFYTWPFPSNFTVSSVCNLAPGSYNIIINSANGCPVDTTIVLTDIPCGSTCNPAGNLVIYSNYDGGILTINVDQNIPNLKVGICTYEPIQVSFTGPFIGNITQVIYAGMNSNQNNNNCGLGNFTTSITGIPSSIVTINPPMNPPLVGYTPAHGNGTGPWGGGMLGVAGLCDTTINAGGGNTPDEVVYYFLNATSGTLLYHQTQYACWVNETLNVSAGGNCCILSPGVNPCPIVTSTDVQVACESFTWIDGITYTSSTNTPQFTIVGGSSGGCDSIVTLNLTINQNSTNVINTEACGSYTAENGQTYTESTTFSYSLPSQNGCDSIISVNLTISDDPVIVITPSSITSIEPGDSLQLIATGALNYLWTPSNTLSCSNCSSPIANPTVTTTYTVTGTDIYGCSSTAQATISIVIECNELFVPTVFSPNGEGPSVNNQLCVFGNCLSKIEFTIYNRWGEVVFSTENISNCWDGTYKDEPCQTGIYFYTIIATKTNGESHVQSGNITLIK